MSVPLASRAEDSVELVELLTVVAELCEAFPVHMGDMLGSWLGAGYSAADLHEDATRLARGLSTAMGLQEPSAEPSR